MSKKKPSGLKKPSLKSIKKKAWDQFSIYIRTRDCLATTGHADEGICVTCREVKPFKNLQAGHFIGGRNNAVLFQERGVHAQCYSCNAKHIGNGRPIEYWLYMEQTYGREVIDELVAESRKTVIRKIHDYIELREHYKVATEKLLDKYNH